MMRGPVMIAAGGTGGHVFPALAVADWLGRQDIRVVWLGTPLGLESRVVPDAGLPLETVTVRGLRGRGLHGWGLAPWMVGRAFAECRRILKRHKPAVMLGMGGYVTGPAGMAARQQRCPLVIHEQNAIPGLTNRWLARLARRVLTGLDAPFAGARSPTFVGNPVRASIAEVAAPRQRYAGRTGQPRLLVVGGSLGALQLNRTVPAAIARLPSMLRPVVRHQSGERTMDAAASAYAEAGVEVTLEPFIDDMAAAYEWADMVVCRAGALTVSELSVAGVPAILVPFPHAVDDHQRANAGFLVEAGGARLLPDEKFNAQSLAAELESLLGDRDRLCRMAEVSRQQGRPDAARDVADICMEVAG